MNESCGIFNNKLQVVNYHMWTKWFTVYIVCSIVNQPFVLFELNALDTHLAVVCIMEGILFETLIKCLHQVVRYNIRRFYQFIIEVVKNIPGTQNIK